MYDFEPSRLCNISCSIWRASCGATAGDAPMRLNLRPCASASLPFPKSFFFGGGFLGRKPPLEAAAVTFATAFQRRCPGDF